MPPWEPWAYQASVPGLGSNHPPPARPPEASHPQLSSETSQDRWIFPESISGTTASLKKRLWHPVAHGPIPGAGTPGPQVLVPPASLCHFFPLHFAHGCPAKRAPCPCIWAGQPALGHPEPRSLDLELPSGSWALTSAGSHSSPGGWWCCCGHCPGPRPPCPWASSCGVGGSNSRGHRGGRRQ